MKRKIYISLIILGLLAWQTGCGDTQAGTPALESTESKEEVQADIPAGEPVQEKEEQTEPQSASSYMVERLGDEALTNTISDDIKAKAKEMPAASYDNLPQWHGNRKL